eukprot:8419014-Pyramimonas_sp.AAC.2
MGESCTVALAGSIVGPRSKSAPRRPKGPARGTQDGPRGPHDRSRGPPKTAHEGPKADPRQAQ